MKGETISGSASGSSFILHPFPEPLRLFSARHPQLIVPLLVLGARVIMVRRLPLKRWLISVTNLGIMKSAG